MHDTSPPKETTKTSSPPGGRAVRVARVYWERIFLKNLRYDFPASIVVFLVALPLCLGIALASDAPLFSGVITGIIAGMVVSMLSGSELSISGPAAGLTVIVAGGIKSVGGFDAFLAAVVLAGAIQIALGFLRAGAIASLFPLSVIKGMLVAIGITIILKQIPHALGGFGAFESDMDFINWFGGRDTTIGLILSSVVNLKASVVLISLVSMSLLLLWETPAIKNNKLLSRVPGPLVAVIFGAAVNQLLNFGFPGLALHAADGHLVQLPVLSSPAAVLNELRFPDFSALLNQNVWVLAATLAAVGSIETLLCIESTDRIDPLRRVSNPNRELLAQGTGNMLAGLVGGIPMTSVIVRSSANIYAGARTRISGFLHGLLLLISVLSLSVFLNHIPLASLAAVLIMVGYKLASPSLFKKMWKGGIEQFAPFAVTILAILSLDLLKGVLIGAAIGLIFVLRAGYSSALMVIREGNDVLFRFTKDVTFIHKVKLRKELAALEPGMHVIFNANRATYIDNDILQMLTEFRETAASRELDVEMDGVLEKGKH
jgi:MFS superfamily sulfate permease-like transporter